MARNLVNDATAALLAEYAVTSYSETTPETDKVFPHSYFFEDGTLHPGDNSGLGVDIDENLAAQFPYQKAYLPANRKFDGTTHSW